MSVVRKEETISITGMQDLNRRLAELRQRVSIQPQIITPQTAREWLEKNIRNRPKSEQKIEAMIRDIRSGRWQCETWDAIAFSVDGILINGQNRLHAIDRSGVPCIALVITGLRETSKEVGDTGQVRRAGQVIKMIRNDKVSSSYCNEVAALARAVLTYHHGGLWQQQKEYVTPSEQIDILAKDRTISDAVDYCVHNRGVRDFGIGTLMPFFRWLTFNKRPYESDVFFAGLQTGANLDADSPILVLRNRLFQEKQVRRGAAINGSRAGLITKVCFVRAWNAFIQGKRVTKFQVGDKIDKTLTIL